MYSRLATVCALVALVGGLLLGLGAQAQEEESYRLGPGDKVRVTVFGQKDLSGDFELDGAGRLSLPLVQAVEAAGLSARALEQAIATKLSPDYLKNPRVSVEVLTYRPFYILGEVQKPGSYAYVNGMTVVNAVALAGGYTYRARTSRMYITRASDKDKKKQPVDENTKVFPGDVIEVPERYF